MTEKPQRIVRSTSPLADQNLNVQPQAQPRNGGKFARRQPLTEAAQKKQVEREAAEADETSLEEMAIPPKNKARKTRVPFGRREAKLTFPPREGFTRRYFNDDPGRIERAMLAGYVHVEVKGSPHTHPGGTNKEGGKRTLYLMEIPDEFYDEDFAAKQEALDEVDNTIYKGIHNKELGDGRYIPKSTPTSVQVRRGTGSG